MEDTLLDYLKSSLAMDPHWNADRPLFSTGELDSVAMLQLITFVEDAFHIRVAQEDVTLDNFDTVAAIVRYVNTKV